MDGDLSWLLPDTGIIHRFRVVYEPIHATERHSIDLKIHTNKMAFCRVKRKYISPLTRFMIIIVFSVNLFLKD